MPVQPLSVAPVVLALVLALSALAKLQDRTSTLSSISLLRMPRALQAPWVTLALPIGELVLALAMVAPWGPVTRAAAVCALALFAVYAAIIARAMTFDPRPSCGCFGRIGDQRVNGRTLARNVLFVALAVVFVAWAAAGHTVPEAIAAFATSDWLWVLGAVVVAAVAVFISGGSFRAAVPMAYPGQAQQHGASGAGTGAGSQAAAGSRGAAGPPGTAAAVEDADGTDEDELEYVRAPIPETLLLDPEGMPVTLRTLAKERAQLLVFGNCYCGSTIQALRQIPEWAERLPAIDVKYIYSGVAPRDEMHQETTGWVDHDRIVWRTLGLQQSPAAVLLGADGLLAGGPVGGLEDVTAFVADIVDTLAEAPPIEYPVPAAEQVVPGGLA